MDQDDLKELTASLQGKSLGWWGLLQIAGCTGLATYAVWAGILMPGFRKVPLKLQVLEAYRHGFQPAIGYELNPWLVRLSNFYAWKAGYYRKISYQRKDLWKVRLHDCVNISVFLAPSVLPLLEAKLLAELPDEARVVAGRFPLPTWTPSSIVGEGVDRAWAYDVRTIRHAAQKKPQETAV
ncbi:protein N-lysine methyltransferase FAM173A isoform X2 [Rhinatrema bivittatum]|uniref:protein N-lysine methyltransferase FAM173A isoform X2 n=1 Tax=Rhinatrema bivittatum TaxID=194408 RepID=UPI00112B7A0F|nr:protein N-lysine methyltransferase FAM173A isoform X2 [Rhinatrema bivittatum]